MQNIGRIALGLGAAAVVASGGSAFTDSNTLNGNNVAGYGTDVVSGAVTTGIEHTLNASGTQIIGTALTFQADNNTNPTVRAGFGAGGASVLCTASPLTRANVADPYTATCDYSASPFSTADALNFNVAVS